MQATSAMYESGECFLKIIRDPSSPTIPIKLQLLEADFLDQQRDGQTQGNGNYIIGGVEFTPSGKRVAYWMHQTHPGESYRIDVDLVSKRILADQIIHLFEKLRPGQVRGVPQGVASFMRLRNLDEYEEAQLVRQKIAACFSVFVKKVDSDFMEKYNENSGVDELSEKVGPGIIQTLAPGEDIEFANPPGTTGYDNYTKTIIRSIAIAYGVTYESISGDLSNVNFSSGRMGWIEMHNNIQSLQIHTIVPTLCETVWEHFCNAAVMKGIVAKKITAEWTPPKRQMLDPVKEAQGLSLQIRIGIISRAEAIRQHGYDPDVVLAEMIAEQKEQDANGMMLECDAKWDANRVNFGKEAYLAKNAKPPIPTAK